jgi:hypothetical protein
MRQLGDAAMADMRQCGAWGLTLSVVMRQCGNSAMRQWLTCGNAASLMWARAQCGNVAMA